jgi:hypothetical protein
MDIRDERTWCDDCTAPEVWQECEPTAQLFLQALPAYRHGAGTLGSVGAPGFDPAGVLALMDLRGVRADERAEQWDLLTRMGAEYARILAAKRSE